MSATENKFANQGEELRLAEMDRDHYARSLAEVEGEIEQHEQVLAKLRTRRDTQRQGLEMAAKKIAEMNRKG